MDNIIRDARFGLRSLLRRPGFMVVALVAMAIGIGFNTAVFSFVETILLRPLPFPAPQELVSIRERQPGYSSASLSAPDYLDLKAQSQSFAVMSGFVNDGFTLTGRDEPEALRGVSCDKDFFRVTGDKAALGQLFTPGFNGREAVLSHGAWGQSFGMDPNIIGKVITLNGDPVVVSGVLQEGFHFPESRDIWVSSTTPAPVNLRAGENSLHERGSHYLRAIGRLKSGLLLSSASAEMEVIGARLDALYPESNRGHRPTIVPLRDQVVGAVESPLWMLMLAVAGILLIACFNVAALQLASTAARRHELAIRAALGASRLHIARQIIIEGLVLSVGGGAAGVLLAAWGIDLLALWGERVLPHVHSFSLDLGALGFTVFTAVVSGLGFALLPAISAMRTHPMEALRQGSRTASVKSSVRSGLIVAEVAIALVLLAGTGAVVRSFIELRSVHTGVDSEGVFVAEALGGPRGGEKAAGARRLQAYQRLLAETRAIPGVESAALIQDLPMSHSTSNGTIDVEGYPKVKDERVTAEFQVASLDYFSAMHIPVVDGRIFTGADREGGRPVVVINEAFRRRFYQNREPVGRRIRVGDGIGQKDEDWLTIVGVVGDVRQHSVQEPAAPEMYLPLAQSPVPEVDLVIRSHLRADTLLLSVRKALHVALPDQALRRLRPMNDFIAGFLATEQLLLKLTALFSAVALGLAMLGIYGVVAYTTTQRTRELGIRAALGAQPADIVRLVMGGGLRLVGVGLLVGVPLALLTLRALRTQLYLQEPNNAWTLLAVGLLLSLAAGVASFLPARRANKLDPMVALRYE